MKTPDEFFELVDWPLLRRQKMELIYMLDNPHTPYHQRQVIEGMLNLIDNLQDVGLAAGIASEDTIFGPNRDKYDHE